MRQHKTLFRVGTATLLAGFVAALSGAQTPQATINLIVQDELGVPVPHASVYMSNSHTHYFLEMGANGSLAVNLPEGLYTMSSAMSVKSGDIVDRFASSEAHVRVSAGDLSSVVFRLKPLPNAVSSMTLSTLQKIGVDPELAKDLN